MSPGKWRPFCLGLNVLTQISYTVPLVPCVPWGTGEFPTQRASNAENVSIWWHHHDISNGSTQRVWPHMSMYTNYGTHGIAGLNTFKYRIVMESFMFLFIRMQVICQKVFPMLLWWWWAFSEVLMGLKQSGYFAWHLSFLFEDLAVLVKFYFIYQSVPFLAGTLL